MFSDIDNDKTVGSKWEYNFAYFESWLLRFLGPVAAVPIVNVITPCKNSAAAIRSCRSPKGKKNYKWNVKMTISNVDNECLHM